MKKVFENIGIYVNSQNIEKDLNLNSMQIVIVLSEIEKKFEIDIFDNLEKFKLPKSFEEYTLFVSKNI